MSLYTVHYQRTSSDRITFSFEARDEAAAWRAVRKTLALGDDETPDYITIEQAEAEDKDKEHPEGRERIREDLITCPYCGWENQDSWEFGGHQEEPLEVGCGVCDRPFTVTMYVEVTYTSEPIKEVAR